MIFVVIGCGCGSCFYIFLTHLLYHDSNTLILVFNQVMAILGIFGAALGMTMLNYGKEMIVGLEKLSQLGFMMEETTIEIERKNIDQHQQNTKARKHPRYHLPRTNSSSNDHEIILSLIVIFISLVPLLVPFVLYNNLDPFYRTFDAVCPNSIKKWIIVRLFRYLLRFTCAFVSCLEVCRMWPLITILLTNIDVKCKDILSLVRKVQACPHVNAWMKCELTLKYYETLNCVIRRNFRRFVGNSSALLLALSFLMEILLNYVSITMFDKIPMPIYLFFPVTAIEITVLLLLLAPAYTEFHETGKRIISQLKLNAVLLPCRRRKFLQLTLRAIKPICFAATAGDRNLFRFTSSSKALYFKLLTEITIDAVLSKHRRI
jgi:hypothetical protein